MLIATLKPHQLQAFLAISDHGSIRAAARALFISQPGLTRTLRELESELGVPLVLRGTAGIELTAYGRAFKLRATRLLEDMLRAREELLQMRNSAAGTVRIGVSSLPSACVLPGAFVEFRRLVPDAILECLDGLLPVGLPLLRSGELDMLLTTTVQEIDEPDLRAEKIFTASYHVAARASHPKSDATSLAELMDDEWLAWDRTSLTALLEPAGLRPPVRVHPVRSFDTALALALNADLLFFVSRDWLEKTESATSLKVLEIREPLPLVTGYAIVRKDAQLTPACLQFLACVRDAAAGFMAHSTRPKPC